MNERKAICHALCQSGKFETGQGGCAPLCMSILGSSRGGPHGCEYAERIHGDLTDQILAAIGIEAAKPARQLAGSTEGESPARRDRPKTPRKPV